MRTFLASTFKGPALFYFDFVVFPLLGLYYLLAGPWSPLWGLQLTGGFLLFTFMEYWVHRVGLHELYYYGVHEYHHKNPRGYVTFPIWYTPAIFAGFWLVFPNNIFTGLVWGFIWFIVWHHVLHHFDLNRWPRFVRRYAQWHLAHHHNDDCNFGITVPIWDYIFRTYRRA